VNWYLAVLKKYADFTGRARRTEFWMYLLFTLIIVVVLNVVEMIIGTMGVIGFAYGLGTLLPSIAVTTRRLHDTGRSGWWQLIGLIPLVGLIVMIVFTVQEGAKGANAYGPDPKAAPPPGAPAAA
jgi:uncharacterized membrane protein YhaH (DUF805 family)